MSKKKSATKRQIKGQQKLFSFFSRANDPKPILKKNATTNGGKKQKQPSPNQASRKETPTPETLKRKAPPSSSSSVDGKSPGAKVGLVDSPSSTNSSDNNSSSIEIGASLRVYNSKEDAWHMVSVYDYRKNEDKHLVKYLNNGDTEWISFKTKKYEVVEKHPSKKLKTSPAPSSKKDVSLSQASTTTTVVNNKSKSNNKKMDEEDDDDDDDDEREEEEDNSQNVGSRRRSSRRSAQQKRKYVFSDDDDDDDDDEEEEVNVPKQKINAKKKSKATHRNSKNNKGDDEDFTLSDLENDEESSSDEEMDGGIAAAKDALKDNDDDWLVDDDESDEDEVVLKKRGKKKKATRKPKAATSSNSRGKKKSSPTPSANNVSLNYSRSSNLGKATILLRTKAATGQCVNDKDGKVTHGMGEHWHDYQKWLYEDRRDGRGRAPSDPEFDPRTIKMPRDWARTIGISGGKLTPAQNQWWDFKRNNFDCVLFFKVGKFYELFHMDADIGVKELSSGFGENIGPMIFMRGAQGHSGFPETSYGKFANILVQRGYRVMRIEQTETPKALAESNKINRAKGRLTRKVVERSICAVVTPGTRTNGAIDFCWGQEDKEPSVLLSIAELPVKESEEEDDNNDTAFCEYGVFFGETQTCSFRIGQFVDDKQRNRLRTLLASIRPKEVIYVGGSTPGLGGVLSEDSMRILKAESHPSAVFQPINLNDEKWSTEEILNELKDTFDTIQQHEEEDNMDPPFNVNLKNKENGDELWRWPGILHELAIVDEAASLVPAGRCTLAIDSMGVGLQHMKRCLVATQVLEKGTFYPYVPVDLQEAAQEEVEEGDGTAAAASTTTTTTSSTSNNNPFMAASSNNTNNKFMVMDSHTLRNLEISENNHDRSSKGTLIEFLDHCTTQYGRRLFHSWMLSPLCDIAKINARLDAVDILMKCSEEVYSARQRLRQSSRSDLERLLISVHSLGSRYLSRDHPMARAIMYEEAKYYKNKKIDFTNLLKGLQQASEVVKDITRGIKENGGGKNSTLLRSILPLDEDNKTTNDNGAILEESAVNVGVGLGAASRTVESASGICAFPSDLDDLLQKAFSEIPNGDKQETVKPKPGTDPEYERLCAVEAEIHDSLNAILKIAKKDVYRGAKYWGTNKNQFQIEVPAGTKVPSNWQFESKKKGFQRYYVPEVLTLKEQLDETEVAIEERCRDALRLIFRRFSRSYDKWMATIQCVAQLDALMSLAIASEKAREGADGLMDLPVCRPEFVKANADGNAILELREARHPCIAKTFAGNGFIPNDTVLGANQQQAQGKKEASTSNSAAHTMLLTGPNMGGKSTLLRQTCICVIMAQLGCYVPAKKCKLSPVDRIFTRIGASDRILEGQSTFFVELSETSTILNNATKDSLVILDELGRGTSTFDGVAIASAVVDKLSNDVQCRTLFATHYHNLVEDYRRKDGISLGNMTCLLQNADGNDEAGKRVTFLYKLRGGSCDDSYGLNVARLAMLPNDVLIQAKKKSDEFIQMLETKTGNTGDKEHNDAIYIINEMKRLKLAVVGNSNGNNQTVDNKKVSSDILKIWKLSKEMNIA
jgi:DNA mismatch repair protein MSH6